MSGVTSGAAGSGDPSFSLDVIAVIAAMMQSATVEEVREALRRVGDVGFRCFLTDRAGSEKNADGKEPPLSRGDSSSQVTKPHLAVCEFVEHNAGGDVAAGHRVVATRDLSAVLQRPAEAPLGLAPSATASIDRAASATGSSASTLVHCVLILLRQPAGGLEAVSEGGPLTLRNLSIQAVDMRRPLESLQTLLQTVYEPLLRSQHEVKLRSQLQDFLSSVRSHCHVFAEVDLKLFVHAEILELCAAYPEADVEQLVEILGFEKCTNTVFLRQVMTLCGQCRSVLDTKFEGRDIVSARDEVAYWQAVLRWVEQVQKQLHCREWQLVHRLLGNRVETSYEVEFKMHAKLVRDYLDHLKSVPFQQIDEVEGENYATLVEELFSAMVRPTKYPASQSVRLLESIVRELAERFLVLVSRNDLLRMETPEAQLQFLRRHIQVLQDMHQRYMQAMELFQSEIHMPSPPSPTRGGTQQQKQKYHALVLSRARQLWRLVNEHFHYERAVKRTFADGSLEAGMTCSFYAELTDAYDCFATATGATGRLWDVTPAGTAEFHRALAAYKRRLAKIDERLALLVGTMLATAQEMSSSGLSLASASYSSESAVAVGTLSGYAANTSCGPSLYRIYSRFRPLRREKVQAVVAGFQMALLEQINREMKNVRERYFDAESCRDAVRITVARFGVTPVVARMLWERSVQREIETYLVRRDAIYEHGWHQLLNLRTIEHCWYLDESLAQFLGAPLDDLMTKELGGDPEVYGTAYALAYLDSVYGKDKPKWSADPYIHDAQNFVQESDAHAISRAKSRLVILRVGSGRGVEQSEVRDVRNFCDIISQRLQERVVQWCEDVLRRIAALDLSPGTMTMKGPLWHLVELSGRKGCGDICISGSVNSNNGRSTAVGLRRVVMPHIPRNMSSLLRDLHVLDGMQLLESHVQLVADVRSFFTNNEERFRIANCLSELICAFERTLNGEDELMVNLATEEYASVHKSFLDGAQLSWSDEGMLQQFAQELSERVYAFCAAVAQVRGVTADMERGITQLRSHAVQKAEAVVGRVEEMHALVNSLYANCANACWWVRRVQPCLDAALVWQLEQHLRRWTNEFLSMSRDPRFLDKNAETEEFGLRPLRVRMRVVFKEISLSLPVAACRHHWVNELNRSFAWVHTLSTLRQDSPHHHHHHQQKQQEQEKRVPEWSLKVTQLTMASTSSTYDRVWERISPHFIAEPLQAIEKSIRDAIEVETQWRRGQQLLNIELGVLQQRLGDDLEKWGDALQHIREMASRLMDYTQPSTLIGGIVIVADDAQKELGRKLDNMTQYIHSRYRDVVEKHLDSCYHHVMEVRTAAENCNVINDLEDAARFLCELPDIKANMQATERQLVSLATAEDYLRRQGFSLPDSWIYVRKVKTEYRAYHDLIERKVKALEFRRPFLREGVKSQEETLFRQIDELEESLHTIAIQVQDHEQAQLEEVSDSAQRRFRDMEERATRLKEQRKQLIALQDALGVPILVEIKLETIMSSMEELQWVCGHIARAYQRLNAIARTPFFEMVPRQLHDEILAIENEVREFPEGVRSHQAYKDLQVCIENRMACRHLMQELRSDAMTPLERAERHWMALKSQLHAPWKLEELTVGDIWRSDPIEHAKIYHDVLQFANGELRLESQLGHIVAFWNDFEFDTMVYQHQFVLIRGWDVIFERLADDLDSFQGLRSSPFFSSQHVIAILTEWDNRLHFLLQSLEVLMVVQRRWVHLDSIFTGNADIRRQLPNDAIQFDRSSREFMKIMPVKAGTSSVPVLTAQDLIQDKKLLSSLQRLEGQLSRVQRALSTYLDMQRRQFPRLFFVGDDDLLETLGNSRKPTLVEKHLPKMFAALARFVVSNDDTAVGGEDKGSDSSAAIQIVGFASADGEKVMMVQPVALKDRALHDWLAEVEGSMVTSLCQLTVSAVNSLTSAGKVTTAWITSFPLQVVCLAFQVWWVRLQEQTLLTLQKQEGTERREPSMAVTHMVSLLDSLALDGITPETTPALRHGIEEIITIAVYQRDVSRVIESKRILSVDEFEWLRVLRLYLSENGTELHCRMADASFRHGFEYLGWYQRLVQTTLTDRCYLTMTQALHARLGGSPIGPAGSGKTETVKALGTQIGRHVLVFNCDDTFDFDAVGRIFLGLCQVGAWGCFDEFNRLEERVLSAVSQQILTIQEALRAQSNTVTLAQHTVPLRESVALFITMNPGFAGRSNLPGNLKQLFRTMTMAAPDRETIVEVMLFAQGFRTAEALSRKIVPLFHLCLEKLSQQAHYDFGLRALKSVLVTAGNLRRSSRDAAVTNLNAPVTAASLEEVESEIVLQSLISSITPRLVTDDLAPFYPLLRDFFPGLPLPGAAMTKLRAAIEEVCRATHYIPTPAWVEKVCQLYHTRKMRHGLMLVGPSGTGKTLCWKTLLRAMARLPVAGDDVDDDECDLSSVKEGTDRIGPLEAHAYVIDPKAMSKAELFGVFEATTREWRDGVFTEILRRIVNNEMGGDRSRQQHWIVFDGDVDPHWVENLNSLLDDNKIYTLPNGERLSLPPSVRIVFEVQDLRYATPATVSRCGMIWFNRGTVPISSVLSRHFNVFYRAPLIDKHGKKQIASVAYDGEDYKTRSGGNCFMVQRIGVDRGEMLVDTLNETQGIKPEEIERETASPAINIPVAASKEHVTPSDQSSQRETSLWYSSALTDVDRDLLQLQISMANVWGPAFAKDGLVELAVRLIHSERYWKQGIMEHDDLQMLSSVQSLLLDGVSRIWRLREQQAKLPTMNILQKYAANVLQYAVLWGFTASLSNELRRRWMEELSLAVGSAFGGGLADGLSLLDVEPDPITGEWRAFRERVQDTVITADQMGANDVLIPTVDTCRHEGILRAWIAGGNAAILCGPPGSGKTMLIASILLQSSEYDAVFLNFSSGTEPKNIIRALEQYCSVQNTTRGPVMSPTSGKVLLLFCDEINLPALDQYGTQSVVQLLRQLIERRGYYRSCDNAWITVEGVQVIGACNPPTDAGRVPLSHRFLRLAPVLFVDFPTKESLHIIYTSYCRAILAFNAQLQSSHAEKLASAMVEVYTATQVHFTSWQQPHYVYSPRDLSRWARAVHSAFLTWEESERHKLRVEGLVRLSVHEGLRIFQDRLVEREERNWTDSTIDRAFTTHFPEITLASVYPPSLQRPVLYSTILRPSYTENARDELRAHIEQKLEAFCEEEVDTALVVYDAMIDHVTRINRVLQQPLGHMLIAGSSGVGKTIIARLVAWMNGMTAVRLGVHRNYQLDDYERDLRDILRRVGCKLERICFIFDDSNIMEASFLEYMNALLASGEVPGLFDGEEWGKLMEEIRESVVAQQCLKASNKPQKLPQEEDDDDSQGRHQQQPQKQKQTLMLPSSHSKSEDAASSHGISAPQREALDTMDSAVYVDTKSEQELYRWFLSNVKRNLHVIFTIDPSSGEFVSRAVSSPALFNRCTIDWFGDWDRDTRHQVTRRLTQPIDIMFSCEKTFQEREDEARDALADAICGIHEITDEVNRVVRLQNANQGTFITPRHFSDCVQQLQLLYEEKRGGSKEQVLHLRTGLAKLDAASEEVEQQRAKLREHEAVLATNSKKAQTMLDCIVTDTETTKQEKQAAERLRQQLQEEEEMIVTDKARVQQQLSAVEPALREAEVALNTIKPEYLREIRAYTTPPQMVKRVLEAVLVVMGEKRADEWDVIKHHIRRDDFLAGVKAFETRRITEEARLTVCAMLQEEDFTYEAARRASKAAGPLLQWVQAQVNYAAILAAIGPLRNRIDHLTKVHGAKRAQLQRTEVEIAAMEASLLQLKKGYQEVTEEIAAIKNTMNGVAARCERATTLLRQLFDERGRWETEAMGFDSEVRTILGDCILAAASLAYFGYFDEHARQSLLFPRWRQCLQQLQIPFREDFRSVVEYLVTPQERLSWEQYGLLKDHLCVENAMILSRCQRYPLLIDPNGVAVTFLLQRYSKDKINTTSFSKTGYLKHLDMAVRFGYPILMQDAEFIDPALSPLINQEIHRVRGHALTRLGAQDVEIAAAFRLFLVTRDSHYQPSPGMAGQVCLINFTVTQSSLQSQCRSRLMLHEHSELDVRRANILRAQGEYQLRLRVLEQELLTSIAHCEGSLLENDALTVALERLKGETESLKAGIAESEVSMQAITEVEAQYQPLAEVVAKMYFALRRFSRLHWLYQFNVDFVFLLLADALAALPARSTDVSGIDEREEDAARLQVLTRHVFNLAHQRVRRGMFAQDHLVLAILLGKLRSGIDDRVGRQITVEEWGWFEDVLHNPAKDARDMTAFAGGRDVASHTVPVILRECGVCASSSELALAALLQRPLFAELRASLLNPRHAEAWRRYFEAAAPYIEEMPAFNISEYNRAGHRDHREYTRRAFTAALLLFYTRRDAFAPAVQEFLRRFFGGDPDEKKDEKINDSSFFTAEAPDLAVVQAELSDSTPLILVANAGSDPTLTLEALARALDVPLRVAVMGSSTGLDMAGRYLKDAMVEGTWVLLKNIHLARAYADVVEKWLHRERSEGRLHRNFRLVLSIEAAPGIPGSSFATSRNNSNNSRTKHFDESLAELPVSLVEASVVLVYEPPPGMKSSLLQTVGALKPHSSFAKQPVDVQRIYLAAAWLHAVVMERLLYIPMGWSTQYEFNDTEFWRILQTVDSWVGSTSRSSGMDGKKEIDRASVPWPALQTIIGTTLYGGKISNEFDQLLLDFLCSQLMSTAVFDDDRFFAFTEDDEINSRLRCRSIESLQDLQEWVRALPDAQTPLWARLPASASRVMSAQHAVATIERLAVVRLIEEGDNDGTNTDNEEEHFVQQAAPRSIGETRWGQKIQRFCKMWRHSLNALGCMRPQRTTVTTSFSATAAVETTSSNNTSLEPTVIAMQREYTFALERLGEILDDLEALEDICAGSRNPTATQRVLIDNVLMDQVPPHWARSYHTFPTTADQWISDFRNRVAQAQFMHEAVEKKTFGKKCLSLGLLFWPGAFLTATKQQAARRQHRSLEQLQLRLELMSEEAARIHAASNIEESHTWHIVGLTLFSARLEANCGTCELLPATSGTSSTPVGALLSWEPIPAATADEVLLPVSKTSLLMRLLSQNPTSRCFATPFYVNPRRDSMLEVVELTVDPVHSPMRAWYERGVCLVAWSEAER